MTNDPVSVTLSESISGLYVDHQISLTFPTTEEVSTATPRTVSLEVDPDPLYTYHPVTTRKEGDLVQVQGETLLSRLTRIYPGLRPSDNGGAGFTPREALAEIIGQWQQQFPWISLSPAATTVEFYFRTSSPDDPLDFFLPSIRMLALDPDDQDSLSAYDILSQFFECFPGYVFRVNSLNELDIVAPSFLNIYPALLLTDSDLTPEQSEDVDASGVFNACSVESQGYTFVEDQDVMPPAFLTTDEDVWEPPGDKQNLGGGVMWNVDPDVIIGGSSIQIHTVNTIYYEYNGFGSGSQTQEHTDEFTLPLDGSVVTWEFEWVISGPFGFPVRQYAHLSFRAVLDGGKLKGIAVNILDYVGLWPDAITYRYLAWKWALTATGTRYLKNNVTRTGSYLEDKTDLPGIAESREAYGLRKKTLNTGVFFIDDQETLNNMALSFVMTHMNPLRKVSLGQVAPYVVRPDHIGKPVVLPDGRTGTVLDWSYSEAHSPGGSSGSSTITVQMVDVSALDQTAAFGEARYGLAVYGGTP
ncbi:hypothetical protein [Deinococcus cellulosilyticus]|uniref:Uncharacterized protein n=1 Tax=Deinococcus cellulosilyticus (strain DSM 18568 / NBRC 106333 / KACC 11606 / 5516J-15) TaxID=1223518 RepID=A0A511N2Z1_DEIC1|nr:hypothetical protein [Deinococcus cellulosilyticus]GEM47220.1 hypothetical protein DC3_28550 [Deinococcus cellulosilyticus NBRC 106333 = KACC 11606]